MINYGGMGNGGWVKTGRGPVAAGKAIAATATAGLFVLCLSGAPAARAAEKGLEFPSNGETASDIRFRFSGANLQPMYPATYVWRVKLRRQSGYYTTFFWGPDGPFTGDSYYGAHPYPDGDYKPTSRDHKWELSINGGDYVEDASGKSTQLGYDVWRVQAMRVFDDGQRKVHEFYWDLPDTTKVIRVLLDRKYGLTAALNPALTFGDAPWSIGNERLSGILRGIQTYSVSLTTRDIVAEAAAPKSTKAGSDGIWYLNLDPVPADIADKSGKGHNPAWVGATRAKEWTGTGTTISIQPIRPALIAAPPRKVTLLGRVSAPSSRPPGFLVPYPGR